MTSYEFRYVSENLVLVRWHGVASRQDALVYLKDLTKAVKNASGKIYFFSDLRQGHITNTRVLREMGHLTVHPNWGGGVALVESLSAEVFVRLFGRFVIADEMKDFIFDSVANACARLERWQNGITQNIDWTTIIPEL